MTDKPSAHNGYHGIGVRAIGSIMTQHHFPAVLLEIRQESLRLSLEVGTESYDGV